MLGMMGWSILIAHHGSRCLRPVTGATDWLIAVAVTGGVTEFLMTGPINSSDDPPGEALQEHATLGKPDALQQSRLGYSLFFHVDRIWAT